MAELYHLTLDELIEFDPDLKEIERFIETADEEKQYLRLSLLYLPCEKKLPTDRYNYARFLNIL